jgi:hypothetical protein
LSRTLILIPHYGPNQLVLDLFQSAGFALPETAFQGEASFIELPAYSFLIVNNNVRNRGFTAACNAGLNRLRKSPDEHQYAWLLNNDMVFESRAQFEQSLKILQSIMESRNWGIASQQVRQFENRDTIVFGGAHGCYPSPALKCGSAGRGDFSSPTQEKWVPFYSVLIRRNIIESVGPMDESMKLYYSDCDYCLMARLAGFGIGYAGEDSYVFHRGGQGADPGGSQMRLLNEDRVAFWNKWIAGQRHAAYVDLMSEPDSIHTWRAGDLRTKAGAFPELRSWLNTLRAEQKISLRDIIEHFDYKLPPTDFAMLCHIADELLKQRKPS